MLHSPAHTIDYKDRCGVACAAWCLFACKESESSVCVVGCSANCQTCSLEADGVSTMCSVCGKGYARRSSTGYCVCKSPPPPPPPPPQPATRTPTPNIVLDWRYVSSIAYVFNIQSRLSQIALAIIAYRTAPT